VKRAAYLSNVPDTARYLGISEARLLDDIARGLLAVVPPHEECLIHEADLDAYLENRPDSRPRGLGRFFRNLGN
jgi:hypothetical protein